MILKVRTAEGNWKYYEGFYAVEITECFDDKVGIECDEIHRAPNVPVQGKNARYRMFIAEMSYPSNMKIAFDTGGYLLNYEGKTIEKL